MIGQFFPRFQADALARNQHVVDKIGALAAEKGCSPAQLALAWVRSVSRRPGMPSIIPIPGSTTVARVHENTSAIELSDADVKAINDMLEGVETAGSRYPKGAPTET
jgi:pyridoxine 4-dehydrogenase